MISCTSFFLGRTNLRWRIRHILQFGIQGENELWKRGTLSRVFWACMMRREQEDSRSVDLGDYQERVDSKDAVASR